MTIRPLFELGGMRRVSKKNVDSAAGSGVNRKRGFDENESYPRRAEWTIGSLLKMGAKFVAETGRLTPVAA